MAITKRGNCDSRLSVISEIYICSNCKSKKTVTRTREDTEEIFCPKCQTPMSINDCIYNKKIER